MLKTKKVGNGRQNRSDSKPKNNQNAGALDNSFDRFDCATNSSATQEICQICQPKLGKQRGASEVCEKCKAKAEVEAVAVIQPARPRKIIKLQICAGCDVALSPSKFSIYHAICRKCLSDAKGKGKTARSNFIERTLNNLRRNLRGNLANV